MLQRQTLNLDAAESTALKALNFIAGDPQKLVRFLSLTGLTPAALRSWGEDHAMQASLLEYLLGDESLLLVFAAECGVKPETVAPAYELLTKASGGAPRRGPQ